MYNKTEVESSHLLLDNNSNSDEEALEFPATCELTESKSTRVFYRRFLLHAFFYTLYSLVLVYLLIRSNSDKENCQDSILQLPAKSALQQEIQYFETKLSGNPLAGKPRPELDESWGNLLKDTNILLPKEILAQFGLTSILTKDGRNGIAQLSIFHALHCIKLVRQMMYKDHYHKNDGERVIHRLLGHAGFKDHCLEYIRESLMCQPDISLVTFVWVNETAQYPDQPERFGPLNYDTSPHQCVNWEKLANWARTRTFDLWNLESLENPYAS